MSASRNQLRDKFLAQHKWSEARVLPLLPDASFRQYLRLQQNNRAAMLMDARPDKENVDAFVNVTRHLDKLGVRVPEIYAHDLEHGFVLLEDLGEHTFTRLLAEGHDESALYESAIAALSQIKQHPDATDIALPSYDVEHALAEANLLLDWYIPSRLEQPLSARARNEFQHLWEAMLDALPPLESTLVLRDYHIDNLMLCGDTCAVLDYQDALIGSPAYDLVSLLEDARRDIAAPLVDKMLRAYLDQNREVAQPALHEHYIVWGAQRHCKVAGIFIRLWLRDGKEVYLQHLPRVMKLLQRHLDQPALQPLRRWLDAHLGQLDHVQIEIPSSATDADALRARLLRHCNTA